MKINLDVLSLQINELTSLHDKEQRLNNVDNIVLSFRSGLIDLIEQVSADSETADVAGLR